MRLVKMDEDHHDFTDAQTSLALPLNFACGKHLLLPDWHKGLAKVIDIAE
jgi:hypothetical protein